jgi:hypothetical protein
LNHQISTFISNDSGSKSIGTTAPSLTVQNSSPFPNNFSPSPFLPPLQSPIKELVPSTQNHAKVEEKKTKP